MKYEYRCEARHDFELDFPMGTAEPTVACPSCERPAYRVFHGRNIAVHPNGTGGKHAD